ncbi:ABC transporter permease [Micropruina sp.]|uniref:ABC transporter permease n=1 Tax=Micropruina sp. TaxID=2737536 RepID=UPI0039E3BADC
MIGPGARWLAWTVFAVPAAIVGLGWLVPVLSESGWAALANLLTTQSGLVRNTMAYGVATAVCGTAFGWMFAHLLHTYRVRAHRVLRVACVAPLMLPSFTFAMALITLFGHNGLVTARLLPGLEVYGFGGLVVAGTLSRFPIAYLALSWAYRRLDPEALEAARQLNASPYRIAMAVMVPRLLPAALSSLLFLLGDAIADVAIPLVIGGDHPTLGTRIYEAVAVEADPAAAGAAALVLVVPAAALWLGASRLSDRTTDHSGAGQRLRRPPDLVGRLLLGCAWVVAGGVLILLAAIVAGALVSTSGAFTLDHLGRVLAGDQQRGLAMSLLVALTAAPLVTLLAFAIVLAATGQPRRLRRARRVLTAVSTLPPAVLGLGAYLTMAMVLPVLLGRGLSIALLPWLAVGAVLTVHLARFVPRRALPALLAVESLGSQAQDTATLLGARRRDVARQLIWPRVRPELAGGSLATFADVLTAVSSVILLTSSQVPLLPVGVLADIDAGRLGDASAATVTLALAVLAVTGLHALWQRDWVRRTPDVVTAGRVPQ